MEITTILGIIVALIGLLGGMIFKHVGFENLANPAAIFIILVGTVGAVLNAFPLSDAKNVGKLFGKIFTAQKQRYTNVEIIQMFADFAQTARKDGILSLESKQSSIDDPFMKRAFGLLFAGQQAEYIESVLESEIHAMEQRHTANAGIFSQAGAYAPTLGVLGAVVGLIAALGNMDDTAALGHAISGAFMATVYGIFTGYVLWHPFANKLKRKSKIEAQTKYLILDGILLINEGCAPNMLTEKLATYLSQTERDKYFPESKEAM